MGALRLAPSTEGRFNPAVRPLIQEINTGQTPETLVERLRRAPGVVLLRSAGIDSAQARYSLVTAKPFLTFRSFGARCELSSRQPPGRDLQTQFGNPWHALDALMARYELLDEIDLPFPLGGCFGYWGYDLKNFTEPKLPRRATNDLELPDCHVGFYDSLVVFDHHLDRTCVVATGLDAEGSRTEARAREQLNFWSDLLSDQPTISVAQTRSDSEKEEEESLPRRASSDTSDGRAVSGPFPQFQGPEHGASPRCFEPGSRSRQREEAGIPDPQCAPPPCVGGYQREVHGAGGHHGLTSNLSRAEFLARVNRALRYIRAGDIYQVNLSQRLAAPCGFSGWELFARLLAISPAPFAAYFDGGDFQIASSSPEQFLRLSGSHIVTRPIKGTRPRSPEATRDAQLAYELQTSPKELAELVMITDLLRNDLGRVCEYGSVQVPELARLERFAQVQHLVSTVEGRLRPDVTHFAALASVFPGGSITGAPKFRAMEIIDALEPLARGPYCGCHGYLGFNRESQLSISIRTAIRIAGTAYFQVGAGIVADSIPEAEYEETLAKGRGFLAALELTQPDSGQPAPVNIPDQE